jgi:hypothetical protein
MDVDADLRLSRRPLADARLRGDARGRDGGTLNMWKVGDVESVSVLGVDGHPYGFNVTTEDDKPLVSFAYMTRDRAVGRLSRLLP